MLGNGMCRLHHCHQKTIASQLMNGYAYMYTVVSPTDMLQR